MLDEFRLRRLAEMGIDVHVPRSARMAAHAGQVALRPATPRARIVLLAHATPPRAQALLEQIARALRFARIEGRIEAALGEAALRGAAGLVVFGAALARQADTAVAAERRNELQWLAAAEIAEVSGAPALKRAFWGELKRMIRAIGAGH